MDLMRYLKENMVLIPEGEEIIRAYVPNNLLEFIENKHLLRLFCYEIYNWEKFLWIMK